MTRRIYLSGLLLVVVAVLSFTAMPIGAKTLIDHAKEGNLTEVQQLLAKGTHADTRDARGRTALLVATWANHPNVAKALIDAGADVNAKDQQQDSPYLVAGAEGRKGMVAI